MDSVKDSLTNEILLNPRLTSADASKLIEVAQTVSEKMKLKSHIWLSTSGSSSESTVHNKLVALSKDALKASAEAVNAHLQVSSADTWLQVLPRFHVGGLGIEIRASLSNSKVVSDFQKWNPARTHQLLQNNKITIASMVPTQVFDLVKSKLKAPANLRVIIVGGGALTEALYREGREWGWPLVPSYGMTETSAQIATASLESLQSNEMPQLKKLAHVEWRTTSEKLLEVKGPSLMTCYGQRLKDGSIRGWDPKVDSWFTTEDHVELQGSYIRVIGRKNDFIKIGGEASSMGRLREIWDRITGGRNCQHAVLVDAPSKRLGTVIHLVSTLAEGDPLMAIWREAFNREVLPFERIRDVKYIAQIPRSELGKVLWAQLKRELYVD